MVVRAGDPLLRVTERSKMKQIRENDKHKMVESGK